MIRRLAALCLLTIGSIEGAFGQDVRVPQPEISTIMNEAGSQIAGSTASSVLPQELTTQIELPATHLSEIALHAFSEAGANTRSAKDAAIYRLVAPAVVLIVTRDGLGSGSLVSTQGQIITNWHVVQGYSDVAVVFKPALEGSKPTGDEIVRGHVLKYDAVSDLALVQVDLVPSGRTPIRLGDLSEMNIGSDVHAIGHPTGENWSYTKGVISQYRLGYEWKVDELKHKADVIQTQTPINPGNSGGPLLADSGRLIGINSFKSAGEGLNFAVSVEDVNRFLARSISRLPEAQINPSKQTCQSKQVFRSRNKENDSLLVGYDTNCGGKANAIYVTPDKQSDPIMLKVDRNGDGRADVIFFDYKRKGNWELSFWDENYDGHWTLVGYHPDGSLKPSRFESYETFRSRVAGR